MKISTRKRNQVNILEFCGRFTHGDGDVLLKKTFIEMLDAGERLFVLDLRQVPYLDSSAVGETVACHKRASERKGVVKLVMTPKGKPEEIFMMTSLHKVFSIYSDMEEALASFAELVVTA